MKVKKISEKIANWLEHANDKGLNIPMVRDPDKNAGSLTATMAVVSFTLMIFALSSKSFNVLGTFNLDEAKNIWIASMAFYLGRKVPFLQTQEAKKKVDDDPETKEK